MTSVNKQEMNLKTPKRNGWYFSDGTTPFPEAFPSVTKILQVINKPALMYWAARETAKICLAEPWITEEEAYARFKLVSQEATTRGKGVHNFYKNFIQEGIEIDYPKHYEPYIDGIRKFYNDFKPTHVHKNKIVKSIKYKYAGEIDSIDAIGDLMTLIDVKTGGSYPEHELQLAAYKQALLEDNIDVDVCANLVLPGDGTYQFIDRNAPLEKFLAVKNCWEKLGYDK